jgi:hypothetical protein
MPLQSYIRGWCARSLEQPAGSADRPGLHLSGCDRCRSLAPLRAAPFDDAPPIIGADVRSRRCTRLRLALRISVVRPSVLLLRRYVRSLAGPCDDRRRSAPARCMAGVRENEGALVEGSRRRESIRPRLGDVAGDGASAASARPIARPIPPGD